MDEVTQDTWEISMPTPYNIAFWNLENFFDHLNSTDRTPALQNRLARDLANWDVATRDRKRDQLVTIIRQMGNGAGPDLLGVCEIENQTVINLLAAGMNAQFAGRNYQTTHANTADGRGIDVAFIFDANLFTAGAQFSHFVMRRTFTRDIFQVSFTTNRGRTLVAMGNHWPARSGGRLESAAYRAVAGETLAYWHERVREVLGDDTPIIVMGDFNDEPFDESVRNYALSWRSRTKVLRATDPKFFNLMWQEMGNGIGSYYYSNHPIMFDQFFVNENMLRATSLMRADEQSVRVSQFADMKSGGLYPTPIRFSGHGNAANLNGYSDHYPIEMVVVEAD